MSISEVVIEALSPLRAHKGHLPDIRTLPAIVVQVISGHDEFHLRGDGGLKRRIIQLDAWASIETGADNYMAQARTKLLAAAGSATGYQVAGIAPSGAPPYDDEANLFRSSYEFTLWFDA
jgi:hypothetical protein